jgi:hypothetical protein
MKSSPAHDGFSVQGCPNQHSFASDSQNEKPPGEGCGRSSGLCKMRSARHQALPADTNVIIVIIVVVRMRQRFGNHGERQPVPFFTLQAL